MRPTRPLAGWMVWVLVALGFVSGAAAAPADIEVLDARFGFCDGLVPERWTPVRLTIASKKDPFSGVLVVTHVQDATQDAEIMVPVATTPGTPTSVEVVLCVPRDITRLKFEFYDRSSGRSKTVNFASGAAGGAGAREQYMPPEDDSGRRMVVVDGPRSLVESAVSREPYMSQGTSPDRIWGSTWAGEVSPDSMPLMWAAYDSADVVVVPGDLGLRGENRVDARAMDALMAWVRAGGRLVVLVEPAGDGWARFVDRLNVIEAADQAEVPLPRRVVDGLVNVPVPSDGAGTIAAAPAMRARSLRLTAEGARLGWQVDYRRESADPSKMIGHDGVVASGPVGLGRVMLVAWDPTKAPAMASSAGAQRLWRDLLKSTLENAPVRTIERDPQMYYWNSGGSGSSLEAQAAIGGTLSEITDVPPLGHGVFIAIAAVVLVLAMLVGPIDWFALKRIDGRKHSWITALLWISVASLACLVAPGMLRSEGNRVFRLATYDAIADTSGTITHACREGIMSVLPGGGGSVRIEDTASGAIHRGVSPTYSYKRSYTGGTLPLRQGTPEGSTLRGITALDMGVRQWNLRAMLDESPDVQSPILDALRVVVRGTERWEVEIEGLPQGASITRAGLETHAGWFVLGPEDGTSAWASKSRASAELRPVSWDSANSGSRSSHPYDYGWSAPAGWGVGIQRPGAASSLPLASTRRGAIERYLASGSWVCVHVQILAWPSDVPVAMGKDMDWETDSQATFRILVPISSEPAPTSTPQPTEAVQP